MRKTAPVSVRLEPALEDRLTAIAAALDRPKSWVIEQVVRDFVVVQKWQLAAIDAGIGAADAGRVVAHEDVVAWVQSWGRPDELPMPRGGWSGRRLRCTIWPRHRPISLATIRRPLTGRLNVSLRPPAACFSSLTSGGPVGGQGRASWSSAERLTSWLIDYGRTSLRFCGRRDVIEILRMMHGRQRWPDVL
jgi:predicted transcriptional regulator